MITQLCAFGSVVVGLLAFYLRKPDIYLWSVVLLLAVAAIDLLVLYEIVDSPVLASTENLTALRPALCIVFALLLFRLHWFGKKVLRQ